MLSLFRTLPTSYIMCTAVLQLSVLYFVSFSLASPVLDLDVTLVDTDCSAAMAMGVLALLLLLVVATEASSPSAPPAAFRSLEEHERRLEGLVQALRGRTKGQRVALQRSVSQSHCPRPQSYKRDSLLLSISGFDKVLSLSPVQKTQLPRELQEYFDSEVVDAVDVQACMSFEALVDALLPLGRIPAVVPGELYYPFTRQFILVYLVHAQNSRASR